MNACALRNYYAYYVDHVCIKLHVYTNFIIVIQFQLYILRTMKLASRSL